MIISNLLTKYILAPIWAKLLIFITFYFIVREFHFMNFDNLAFCMYNPLSEFETSNRVPYENLTLDELKRELRDKEQKFAHNERVIEGLPKVSKRGYHNGKLRYHSDLIYYDFSRKLTASIERLKELIELKTKEQPIVTFPVVSLSKINLQGQASSTTSVVPGAKKQISDILGVFPKGETTFENSCKELKESIPSMIAESKSSIIEELQESIDEFVNIKVTEAESRITSNLDSRILAIEEQQKNFVNQDFIEQLKFTLLNKQEEIQHKNQQAFVNLEITQQASQRDVVTNLRNSFDRKLDMANNEILDLKTQNIELQKTVTQYVAEAKGQQKLIDNVRKSFERKMQAKDLLISQLQEKNVELSKTLSDVQQTQAKMAHDIAIMKDRMDVFREFQQLSMHKTSLETAADVKTAVLPRSFSDIK